MLVSPRQRLLTTRFYQILASSDLSTLRNIAGTGGTSSVGSFAESTVSSTSLPARATPIASALQPALANWSYLQVATYAKATKTKGGKKGGKDQERSVSAAPEIGAAGDYDITFSERNMQRAIDHLQHELANIRTGRATPGMLDHLQVEIYGERLPLKAVGAVSVRDSQLLAVTVFDPSTVETISAAIRESPLQLNPRVEGQELLVPIPRPTAETMAAMAKLSKAEGESAKVTVRHVRKLAMESVASLPSEDEQRRAEKEVQAVTDRFVAEIERIVSAKQKDIALNI